MSILTFDEHFVTRIWGGEYFSHVYAGECSGSDIGEVWLISDHKEHCSIVNRGKHAGSSLRDVIASQPRYMLGARGQSDSTVEFPLLLKVIDAQENLSVQVHPDDRIARQLTDERFGKTESWFVLDSEPGAYVLCGLHQRWSREELADSFESSKIVDMLKTLDVEAGQSVFIPAGEIHAIGKGCRVVEIQQNSNTTYRIYDWDRVTADGTSRATHHEEALLCADIRNEVAGLMPTLAYTDGTTSVRILACCEEFAGEEITLRGDDYAVNRGETFQIVLALSDGVRVSTGDDEVELRAFRSALVPAGVDNFRLTGHGQALMYYVPDIAENIQRPLLRAGHRREAITAYFGNKSL